MSERVRSVVLALLMVFSIFAGVGMTTTTAAQSSAPSDMVGIPSSNVQDDRPSHAQGSLAPADLRPQTSKHADTTELSIVTESQASAVVHGKSLPEVAGESVCKNGNSGNPKIECDTTAALVISDETHHEGRQVAIRAASLREEIGHEPSFITVRNSETGEEWRTPVEEQDGWYVVDVKHFSSNAVSFTGEITQSFDPASDGSSAQYELSDLDAADNFTIGATGVLSEEWDNESQNGIDPDGGQMSISPAGNLDPSGPSGGDPELTVTSGGGYTMDENSTWEGSHAYNTDLTSSDNEFEVRIEDPPDSISEVKWAARSAGVSGTPGTYDVRISDGPPDQSISGTVVASDVDGSLTGNISRDVDFDPSGSTAHIEFDATGDWSDGSMEFTADADADGGSENSWQYRSGDGWESSNSPWDVGVYQTPATGVSAGSENLGDFVGGETKTTPIDISTIDDSIDFTGSGAPLDASLDMRERTETPPFGVEVNGNWENETLGLSDGESTSLSTDTTWLKGGINRVNVSVGDGSLSSDAPAPKVGIQYSHDATDKKTVTYNSDRWVDRYNISHTYASDRNDAHLSIPFENTVYTLNSLEYRIDGGTWSSVADSDYQLSGNDLDVDLDALNGGSVPAGTEIDVRTHGSKVDPKNMSIEVANATDTGTKLDSLIEITSAGTDPRIEVGGTQDSSFAHYTFDETWNADTHSVFGPDGNQELNLPGASAGNSFRVTYADTEVSPSSGDVEVSVESAGAEPTFDVAPGPNGKDTDVTFTHHRTTSGAEYVLNSVTDGIAHDSETAQSPVTLQDDDSEETLEIVKESGSSSTGDGGDGSGPFQVGQYEVPNPGPNWPLIILAVSLALAALAIVQWRTGMNPLTSTASSATDAGSMLADRPQALAVILVVGAALAMYTGVIELGDAVLAPLAVAGVAVGAYVGLKRMGRFSMPVYISIVAVTAFATLSATGQLSAVVDALGPLAFVLIGGLLYLAYQYMQQRGEDKQINFNLRSE